MPDTSAATFGIEEEFVLLDPATLTTVPAGVAAVAALGGADAGAVAREFHPSQIEFATPVCVDADQALASVIGFRTRLAAWADEEGLLAAATGTPFTTDGHPPLLQGRYAQIAHDIGGLSGEHQLNGLHVHVGLADRDARVRASNSLRPWLPTLLAISSNSPFWLGHDTGFSSWRAIHSRRWTTHGIPPYFSDADDYDAGLARIAGVGATSDAGTVNWSARLSAVHATLEVRICDAQLDPWAAVALAVVIRALVVAGSEEALPRPEHYEAWDAALWHAARHGTSATLVDARSGRLVAAAAAVDRLRTFVSGRLGSADRRLVDGFFARLSQHGPGAAQQRHAFGRGRLGDLFQAAFVGAGPFVGGSAITADHAVPAPPAGGAAALR